MNILHCQDSCLSGRMPLLMLHFPFEVELALTTPAPEGLTRWLRLTVCAAGLPSSGKRTAAVGIPGALSSLARKIPSFGRKSSPGLPSTPEDGPGLLAGSDTKPAVPSALLTGHSTGSALLPVPLRIWSLHHAFYRQSLHGRSDVMPALSSWSVGL